MSTGTPPEPQHTPGEPPLSPAADREPEAPRKVVIRLGARTPDVRDVFLDGRLEVWTTKGVRGPDRVLLEGLPPNVTGRVLVSGTREALASLGISLLAPDADVEHVEIDAYPYQKAVTAVRRHKQAHVRCLLTSDFPTSNAYDWVVLLVQRTGDAQLTQDLVRQAQRVLKSKGKILAACDNPRDRWLHGQILEGFGAVTIHHRSRQGFVYIARKQAGSKPLSRDPFRTFDARFPGRTIPLETRPGVFSHGELDGGALALADAAGFPPGGRVLDMGCGSGAIGVLAALSDEKASAVLVDSSTLAATCAARNVARSGVAARCTVLLSCDFECLAPGSFDLVLANPPYFGDWKIAELFARQGHRVLRPGGRFLLVTKAPDPPAEILRELFGASTGIRRRGYVVLEALKR